MLKKSILFAGLLFTGLSFAQIGTSIPTTKIGGSESKWTLGGYAGLGGVFGSNGGGTSVYIVPRAGYKVTNNFEVGLAGNFTWQSSSYYSSTMFGVGPFANYYFGRSAYVSGLFQEYFVNTRDKYYDVRYSDNEAALYLGGGYMQRLGGHAYMQIGLMYNVLYRDGRSVFGGGLVPNIGIVYGL